MATSVTLFQFGFCVLLPLTFSKCRRKRRRSGGEAKTANENDEHENDENDVIQNFPKSWKELSVYIKLSAIVYGSTAFATMSLGYEGVTYVTKVVFKSAKLIPTMVVSVFMDARDIKDGNHDEKKTRKQRRNYGVWEYASALLLCVGAAGFCMSPGDFLSSPEEGEDGAAVLDALASMEEKQDGKEGQDSISGQHWIGIALLTASVFCDALVPNIQEQLMHGTAGPSSSSTGPSSSSIDQADEEIEMKSLLDQSGNRPNSPQNNTQHPNQPTKTKKGISSSSLMVNTNAIGFTLLLLSTIISSTFFPIIAFISTQPYFLLLLTTIGMGLGSAVLAYTELIRRSGPAVAVTVATLRKVVTVMLSYIIFPKAMSMLHLCAGFLVLGGLMVGFMGRGRK